MENKNFTIIYKDGRVINQNTLTSVKQLMEMDGLNINVVVNNLNNDILVDNTKIESTLVQCDMVEDIESIEFDGNYISTDIGEYIVFDNYEDAENQAVEYCINTIEECGINDTLLFEAELKGWIDEEYFREYWSDLHYSMAYDEGIYNIMDADEVELYESGELLEDDIRDNYYNSLQDSIQNNWIDEFKFQFGDDLFNDIVIKENLIDIEELSKWCVDMDGVAHYIAHYDGDEIECNGYYIYRTN